MSEDVLVGKEALVADQCMNDKSWRIGVGESTLPGIESVRKKSTAELRQRFPAIKALLQEGYTHKQICGLLNSAGVTISYAYYRVVMTRLRTEFESAPVAPSVAANETAARIEGTPMKESAQVRNNEGGSADVESAKSLSWDPVAPVQWK